jgi:molecular chaperone GrpE
VKRGNGDDRPAPPPGENEPEPDAPAAREESHVEAVEGGPMAPLTREQVEALRAERDDLADQLLRKRAEFENFRRRVERERQGAGTEALAALLKDLVPTLDNLDRALETRGGDAESVRQGVEMIRRGLLSLLEARGVTIEDPMGEPFDPLRHQALSHEPAPGHPEGTVVEVYQKGYSYKDRLLRPALVKVAKSATPAPEDVHSEPEKVH